MLFCDSSTSASSRGKRSRSNSSSSSSSSSAASSTGGSIFSRLTCTDSTSSISNYSSPADSSAASPDSKLEDADRPCKLLKTNDGTSSEIASINIDKATSLEQAATLLSVESERPLLASCGRNHFVDCLVGELT